MGGKLIRVEPERGTRKERGAPPRARSVLGVLVAAHLRYFGEICCRNSVGVSTSVQPYKTCAVEEQRSSLAKAACSYLPVC
eukprot:6198475-Pleurochrysis_carterae.AAC.2